MPTDEERSKLEAVQQSADDVVLGSAEQFLAMLCSVPDLSARLMLWAYKLDYDTTESVSRLSLSSTLTGDKLSLFVFQIVLHYLYPVGIHAQLWHYCVAQWLSG